MEALIDQQKRWKAEGAIKAALRFKGGERPNKFKLEETQYELVYEGPFTTMRACFTLIKDEPNKICIGTTFWRAENEVNAVFPVATARQFFQDLQAAGFKKSGVSGLTEASSSVW